MGAFENLIYSLDIILYPLSTSCFVILDALNCSLLTYLNLKGILIEELNEHAILSYRQ